MRRWRGVPCTQNVKKKFGDRKGENASRAFQTVIVSAARAQEKPVQQEGYSSFYPLFYYSEVGNNLLY